MSDWLICTDMDGSLISATDFSLGSAQQSLEVLATRNVTVVLVTSKTATEIQRFRRRYRLSLPAIVENGGGFLAQGACEAIPLPWAVDTLTIEQRLPEALAPYRLSRQSQHTQAQILGLSGEDLPAALDRQFSVPLMPQVQPYLDQLPEDLVAESGGRIVNVAGIGQSKAGAIGQIKTRLGRPRVMAIGDGPNDLSMFHIADYSALIYNPNTFEFMRQQAKTNFISTEPAPLGWTQAIDAFFAHLGTQTP